MAAESLDRLTKAVPYRKYRPKLHEYKGHYREWYLLFYLFLKYNHIIVF